MNDNPLVSVIIVNWNGGEIMRQCLESLSKIKYSNYELIIVDNGSTDGSENIAANFQFPISNFQLIKNKENLGFAKANNQGYKKTRGEYVLLLNNDTKVKGDFLSRLVTRMEEDYRIGVIQPKIYLMDRPGYLDNAGSFLTKIGFLQHWGFGQRDRKEFAKEREIFSAKGACMLIRREVIEKVGLFDNDFFSYFEESDFCWRVWLSGYKVIFYPGTVIYHKLGFTIRRLNVTWLNYHYYKNRICSLLKNLEVKNLLLILIPHIMISEFLFLIFLIRGQFSYSFMIKKAIIWNIWNLPEIYKKRKRIQKIRKLNDRELFRIIVQPINLVNFFGDFKRMEEDLKRPKSN